MCTILPAQAGGLNVCAFLDMIAHSELGDALLAASDDGYNVIVGSTAAAPILFDSYADHPHRLIGPPTIPVTSSAAGRYQLLGRYWDVYKAQLGLPDYGKLSQDTVAIQQVRESLALQDVIIGNLQEAIAKTCHIWASLPGSPYGQHTNQYQDLRAEYLLCGGTLLAGQ
jgi:muramidase (phage lysozyme)